MNIKSTIVPFQQGTPEWAQHRARSLNASELAIAMGISSNMQRNELIKCKATGIPFEHSDFVEQRVFAPGHAFEAAARPLAEDVIGEDLYASVFAAEVDGMLLSASLDGHTMMNDITWEHKQASDELIASLDAGIIPDQYHPQMEQGFLLTGATKCMFSASKGTKESMRSVWYESNPELRAKIIPTWKQFMADVAAYVPTEAAAPKPEGKAPESLPALLISIKGEVSASNLAEFKQTALTAIQSVNRELTTDVQFADAEKAVKWCEDIESRIKGAKEHALAQTASIDELFRTMDEISAEARRVRLDLAKLVASRKEAIKGDIVAAGVAAFAKYIRELNAAMPGDYMPQIAANFGVVIKNLRTVASLQNAVDTELSRVNIEADATANRIRNNCKAIDAADAPSLFADIKALVLKQPEDLAAIIAQRVAAEDKRKADETEQIRLQEVARIERENAAKVETERKAKEQAEAVQAQRIRDEQAELAAMKPILQSIARETAPLTAAEVEEAESDRGYPKTDSTLRGSYQRAWTTPAKQPDNGARMTISQMSARLHPIAISGKALSEFGFEPVEKLGNATYYRERDFPAICEAIARHVLAASTETSKTL